MISEIKGDKGKLNEKINFNVLTPKQQTGVMYVFSAINWNLQ